MPDAPTIPFPLALTPSTAAVHRPAGWFVGGADPAAWLDEIAGWGVPMTGLRLYVVPIGVRDRRPAGVLITAPDGATPTTSPRAQPYGRLAGRLYLPADARLDPPASDAELREKLVWPVQLLHPAAGLVGFADEDALRASDLLAAPEVRDVPWDRAAAGVAPPPRLTSVEPEEVPSIAAIFGGDEGRGDIGTEPAAGLPRTPDESPVKDALSDAASKAGRPPLKFLKWLADRAPGGGKPDKSGQGQGGGGWRSKLGAWASGKLGTMSQGMHDARMRELQRLQDLLAKDPDRGLRYAIPLKDGGTRGTAPPGASLPPRATDFDLSHLGGGRPGDAWAVPWEVRQRLIAQYRAAANRELDLGRHRRAAYIFAELIGDYPAAANALEQGRHFREAAALYRTFANNPLKAADCLERGGLLLEAVVILEDVGLPERAGDLYAKIDRPDDAARCWRLAVGRLLVGPGDPLAAAKLLETKLAAPDEALQVLDDAWRSPGRRSAACLQASFDLLGRLGRHDETAARAKRLRDGGDIPADCDLAAVLALAAVAAKYPNPAARLLAADAVRVVAGRRLLKPGQESERGALVETVTKLAPEDRLLARDGNRFLARRKSPRPAAPPAIPARGDDHRRPVVVHQFRLPGRVRWRDVAARGGEFYAAGLGQGGAAHLLRGRWDGATQSDCLPNPPPAWSDLVPCPNLPHVSAVPAWSGAGAGGGRAGAAGRTGAAFVFPPTGAFADRVEVETPAWLPVDGAVALFYDEAAIAWVVQVRPDGQATLATHDPFTGAVLATYPLGEYDVAANVADDTSTLPLPPRIVVRSGKLFAVWPGGVLRFDPAAGPTVASLPRPVLWLAASAPFTRVRVAAAMTEGGVVLWEDGREQPFGEGMAAPRVAFTRGGLLIALTADEGRVYQTDGTGLKLQSPFRGPGGMPLAVVPTPRINEFAVFMPDGVVRVYQVPG